MDAAKNGSNPFSFKTFLKRGEGPVAAAGGNGGEVGQTSSKKGSVRKTGKKTHVDVLPVPFPDEEKGGRKADSENPFSFSKFVERKSSKKPPLASPRTTATPLFSSSPEDDMGHQNQSKTISTSKTSKPARVSSSSSSPPQLNKKEPHRKTRTQRKEISIFDISDGSDSDGNTVVSSSAGSFRVPPTAGGKRRGSRQSGSRSTSGTSSGNSPENPRRGGLELGGLGNGGILGGIDDEFVATPGIKKLKADNERLQKELAVSQEEVKKYMEQNASLKSKIKVLKKKEAEECKALEDMVQKVESNLVTTTKRAVSAEASIGKLKQEIASLQGQLTKSTPQAVHQHYEEILRGVREKSTFASQQLAAASMAADKNIRELLSGVDTLKNIAEILRFVDRISEVRTDDNGATPLS